MKTQVMNFKTKPNPDNNCMKATSKQYNDPENQDNEGLIKATSVTTDETLHEDVHVHMHDILCTPLPQTSDHLIPTPQLIQNIPLPSGLPNVFVLPYAHLAPPSAWKPPPCQPLDSTSHKDNLPANSTSSTQTDFPL